MREEEGRTRGAARDREGRWEMDWQIHTRRTETDTQTHKERGRRTDGERRTDKTPCTQKKATQDAQKHLKTERHPR